MFTPSAIAETDGNVDLPFESPGARIVGVFVGLPQVYWEDKLPTSIRKVPIIGPVSVTEFGLAGDRQADTSVHGGPEKALHIYPAEHYAKWRDELPRANFSFRPGAFGENISVQGLSESSACIGDVYQIGTCILQITQGRTPCWKLSAHVGNSDFATLFLRSGRTGWYARVLTAGTFLPSDRMKLLERPNARRSVSMVTKERTSNCAGKTKATRLSLLSGLSANWTKAFRKMAMRT